MPLMNRSGKSGGSKPRRRPGVPSTSISRSKRCSCCNFFENGTNPARMEAYVTTLCGEIKRRADTPLAQRRPFGAVYLGGRHPDRHDGRSTGTGARGNAPLAPMPR